jgi:hypothetical protein
MHGFEWEYQSCTGNGFSMTNANNGVLFGMDGFGTSIRLAWTRADSDDAWQ